MRPTANSIKCVLVVKQSVGESASSGGNYRFLILYSAIFRVTVQAEQFGGFADAAPGPLERPGDEDLFELPAGVVVAYSPIQHLSYEVLELIPHERC